MAKKHDNFSTDNVAGRILMKRIKRVLSFTLVLALMFSISLEGNSLAANAKKKIQLNKKKVTLVVGNKTKLKLKNNKKKVKWSSSKRTVAIVSSKGVVTAKKKGTATITAKAGKKKYTCKVTVKAKKKQAPVTTRVPVTTQAPNATETPTVPKETQAPTEIPNATETPTVPKETQAPNVNPSSTPTESKLEEIPQFLGFKTYEGKEIITDEEKLDTLKLFGNSCMRTFAKEAEANENNWINKDEMLLLKLSYENKKRDSIIEIVLNDSDYGKKQIYTTAASVNKILSSDTYYDEERDSYITDVLLQMPITKSETERVIEIDETCFLREVTGVKGYADMSTARQTRVNLKVSEKALPSYPVYFDFLRNDDGTYTVLGISSDYELPDVLYIPPTFNGNAVTKIADKVFENVLMTTLIVPESITTIGYTMKGFGSGISNLSSIVMLGMPPALGSLPQMKVGGKIYVPEEYAYQYQSTERWKNSYIDQMYYEDETGELLMVSDAPKVDFPSLPECLYTAEFPVISITENNEAVTTYYNKYNFHSNVTWDEENHTVSFTGAAYVDYPSNAGLALNLNPVNRGETVDLSSYSYLKCDIESDAEFMVKLLSSSDSIWEYKSQMFEGNFEGNTGCTGRRTIYFPLDKSTDLTEIAAILVNANEKDVTTKIYSMEFVKEKEDNTDISGEEFVYEGLDTSWIDPEKPMVAFTFDDGPVGTSDTDTSMIIQKALHDRGAHATFFYIGEKIDEDGKAEIAQAAEYGFEIGNHSYGWNSLSNCSKKEVNDSIGNTNALLTEITGYSNFLFRAPNFSYSTTMFDCIKAPFIDCSVDSKDWSMGSTAEKIIENVKAAQDGDIILMHATYKTTAEAVPVLLEYFQEKGYQVVSVSELFAVRGQKLMTGQKYNSCFKK